jgi:hypothetical protein
MSADRKPAPISLQPKSGESARGGRRRPLKNLQHLGNTDRHQNPTQYHSVGGRFDVREVQAPSAKVVPPVAAA